MIELIQIFFFILINLLCHESIPLSLYLCWSWFLQKMNSIYLPVWILENSFLRNTKERFLYCIFDRHSRILLFYFLILFKTNHFRLFLIFFNVVFWIIYLLRNLKRVLELQNLLRINQISLRLILVIILIISRDFMVINLITWIIFCYIPPICITCLIILSHIMRSFGAIKRNIWDILRRRMNGILIQIIHFNYIFFNKIHLTHP